MFAFMNAEALALTIETRHRPLLEPLAPHSGRRATKAATCLHVVEMRTDCDQDVLWLASQSRAMASPATPGERSCFYRSSRSRLCGCRTLPLVPAQRNPHSSH